MNTLAVQSMKQTGISIMVAEIHIPYMQRLYYLSSFKFIIETCVEAANMATHIGCRKDQAYRT